MAKQREDMKKQYILFILDIIKENSDENNPIDFTTVSQILEQPPYLISIERKTFWRTIDDLKELGYPICDINTLPNGTAVVRNGKPLRQRVYYDWAEQEITDSQIYLLIDSVLSSPHINEKEADETIKWLRKQASVTFRQKYATVRSSDYGRHIEERVVLMTIETIDNAVRHENQIQITYNDFDEKGRLKPKEEGIIINPYYTVIRQGHYYLICSRADKEGFYHYRLDKISDAIVLRDTKRLPIEKMKKDFDLNTYIQQHPYMFAGEVKMVRFLIDRKRISALYDFFGDNKAFSIAKNHPEEERLEISMRTNLDGFYYWALQYGESVEVLEPQELRDKMRSAVSKMRHTYLITNDDMYSEALTDAKRSLDRGAPCFLRLDGINLQGKREYREVENVRRLSVGNNNLDSYEWVNNFKEVTMLRISEPAILDDLILKLPKLGLLNLSRHMYRTDVGEEKVKGIKNFNFLSESQSVEIIDIGFTEVESFEGIYDLPCLDTIRLAKETFEKLDLSRFSHEAKVEKERGMMIVKFEEVRKSNREKHRLPKHI